MTAMKKYYKGKYGSNKNKQFNGYPSQNNAPSYYAFHDIDMHKDEIDYNIRHNQLGNYKFVMSNPSVKIGRVNAPGYPDGKRLRIYKVPGCGPIDGVTMIIDNSENFVNEYGICLNPEDVKTCGYDWSYDTVQVEVGGEI